MMGNIFAKHKKDISTAMTYYDQALVVNPDDYITINNIGFNLMQEGKLEEAKKYFWEAIKINKSYPNSHFALGIIAKEEGDEASAFYSIIKSLKLNKKRDALYENSVSAAFDIAKNIISSDKGKKVFRQYRYKLEFDGDKQIEIYKDEEIQTAAKIEFAESYGRDNHIIRYNPNFPASEHLIMHELVHLDLVIQVRKNKENQLFTSNQEHKIQFLKTLNATVNKLKKMDVPQNSIESYTSALFDGMNSQIYNAPIDLFIEEFLYNEFPDIRAYQFLSLYKIVQDGIKAVTDKEVLEISPKEIISKSKIYNLLNALQYKELYGIDFIKEFKATKNELDTANRFYEEFLEYRDDKLPAEEYELIRHWAEDLNLNNYFDLVDELDFRIKQANDSEDKIDRLIKDPDTFIKEEEMDKFQKSEDDIGTNMAVVMFMVDALQFFNDMSQADIKQIAFDIAMQGTEGYNPKKDGYTINSIKDKSFSGYHILAYYYVSWALAIPEMLSQLQLPYDKEYEMALTMFKSSK